MTPSSPTRVALGAMLLAVGPGCVFAQQAALPQPSATPNGPVTTLHATARLVVLDVVVTDGHGHPLKGLKPEDFALTEDGVPQAISSFTERDAAIPPTPDSPASSPALPPNTFAVEPPVTGNGAVSVIVLGDPTFFDTHSDKPPFPDAYAANSPMVRKQMREYIQSTSPATPIAIFRIDWQGLHLVQSLTADRKVLEAAIESGRLEPPLGFAVRYARNTADPRAQLIGYLRNLQGRVNLIWFSQGQDTGGMARAFPDIESFVHDLNGSRSVLQLSRVALYPIDSVGLIGNSIGFGPALDSYAAGVTMSGCQLLKEIAASTGGAAFCDTNNFKDSIQQAVESGSHFYTISYSPTNPNWNGAFRRIKVNVDTHQSAAQAFSDWLDFTPKAVYRDGYYARAAPVPRNASSSGTVVYGLPVAPPDPERPAPRKLISYSAKGDPGAPGTMRAAMAFAMPLPYQIPFRVTVTPDVATEKLKPGASPPRGNFLTPPFRDQPYRNLKLHYAVDPKALQISPAGGGYYDSLQFVAVLYRDDGVVANSAAYTVPIQADADQYFEMMSTSLTFHQTIAIPAGGNFFLRVGVHEISSGHIGALEVPSEWIKVPTSVPHP